MTIGKPPVTTPSVCPSCELEATLVDDGQGLGLLICANCKAVSDILDETPFWKWPGNDKSYAEAMGQSLKDWMRQCHRELLGRQPHDYACLTCGGGWSQTDGTDPQAHLKGCPNAREGDVTL